MEIHHKTHLRAIFWLYPPQMTLYLAHTDGIEHTSSGRQQPHTTSSSPSLCRAHRGRRTRDETKSSKSREQSPARSLQDPSCCHPPQHLFSPFMVLPLKAITAQSYSQGTPMNSSKPGLHTSPAQSHNTSLGSSGEPRGAWMSAEQKPCTKNSCPT